MDAIRADRVGAPAASVSSTTTATHVPSTEANVAVAAAGGTRLSPRTRTRSARPLVFARDLDTGKRDLHTSRTDLRPSNLSEGAGRPRADISDNQVDGAGGVDSCCSRGGGGLARAPTAGANAGGPGGGQRKSMTRQWELMLSDDSVDRLFIVCV